MSITVNMHLRETAQVEIQEFNAFRTIFFQNADMQSVSVFVTRDQYESVAAKLREAADALEATIPARSEQIENGAGTEADKGNLEVWF